ncbi:DJ-1/PfpI family protein [Pseudonocardia spinosispora]|uniref:DJ-1/PfpI family protein n=1 Tax=Pseudonocardia spinosispora TaxID=103441 RepID=UPI00040639D4|nr:DJ-1/PfpI family protein [Pseudonocardia spinosispora]
MTQIAFVLAPGVTALDVVGPYELLRLLPDAEVRFVSHEPGPVLTDGGVLSLVASHSFAETPSPDIVLVPAVSVQDARVGELVDWLRGVHETTRWTTSVCGGAILLAMAGILNGHPATTHWVAQPLLSQFGAESRPEERIVRSGRIVTAAGVSAGIDLALWLVGELYGAEQAEVVQLMIEYDPQPPYDSGHVSKASARVLELATARMAELYPGESQPPE